MPANDPRRTQIERMSAQLDALVARARGDHAGAVEQLTRLAGADAAVRVAPAGPPVSHPLAETLGAALVDARRFTDAIAVYERALVERPNRSAALLALARTKKAAGDAAGASAAYARLLANWQRADPDLPALTEAKSSR
jgi:predicted Zn-dependent protease